MKKIKMYQVIGRDYDCVYITALSSKPMETVKRELEEKDGTKIDRLEHISTFPA